MARISGYLSLAVAIALKQSSFLKKHVGLCVFLLKLECALNCSFCSTGKQGFNRNLTTAEIIGQLWFAVRTLSAKEGLMIEKVTNVVMMGHGRALLNFDNVVAAMDIMMHDFGYGLSNAPG